MPTLTDHEFSKHADEFMANLLVHLDELDPDDVDCMLAMGVLTMEFADGSKCIMNRQTAAHQIWLAYGATAWHFDFDSETSRWADTKDRGELTSVLAETISTKLGHAITL
jgi:CyaY protein